jgi:homoserine acetyltransferase
VGIAGMYMMTAEDIEYTDDFGRKQSEDSIGFEIDAYVKYMLYKNVELTVNTGFLFADDAMDYFDVVKDGDSDDDIWRADMRIRYKF